MEKVKLHTYSIIKRLYSRCTKPMLQAAEHMSPIAHPSILVSMKLCIGGTPLHARKKICPSDPQLIVKAKVIAAQLSKPNFKGSNGWFEKWKKKYNIRQVAVCGESGDVHGETVDSWKERLQEILSGYSK